MQGKPEAARRPDDRPVVLAPCPSCGAPINPLRARHVAVVAGRVTTFCSPACLETGPAVPTEPAPPPPPPRSPGVWRWALAATPLFVLGGVLLGARISVHWRTAAALPQPQPAVALAPAPAPPAEPEEPPYGPAPPPPGYNAENDRWVHPLPGPARRLPERPSRRFGAERDHDSPDSCGSGHCGVDVGEVAGEPVLAVHEGVVEKVVREPTGNGDRAGKYVRLLHYGGRIVTQYMHLAQVAPDLKPGMHVAAGEPLGTVGDSGTQSSGPHLHFTFATRNGGEGAETYVDPLALLTVWPLQLR